MRRYFKYLHIDFFFSPITVFHPCQERLILKRFEWISHRPDLANSCLNQWNSDGHFQKACKIATIAPHDFLSILRPQISKRHYLLTFSQTEKKHYCVKESKYITKGQDLFIKIKICLQRRSKITYQFVIFPTEIWQIKGQKFSIFDFFLLCWISKSN